MIIGINVSSKKNKPNCVLFYIWLEVNVLCSGQWILILFYFYFFGVVTIVSISLALNGCFKVFPLISKTVFKIFLVFFFIAKTKKFQKNVGLWKKVSGKQTIKKLFFFFFEQNNDYKVLNKNCNNYNRNYHL